MPAAQPPFVFYTSVPPEIAERLAVVSVGEFLIEKGSRGVQREGWRVEHLIYTLRGRAIGHFGGKRVTASPGTLWFMPKDMRYEYRADPLHAPWEGRWIEYDGTWARQLWRMMKLEGVLELHACFDAEAHISELFSILQTQGNDGANEAAALLVRLLALAGRFGGASARRPAHDPIALVQAFVSQHLAEELSLSQLARAARLSPYHFWRLFRTRTGFSPGAYVRSMRISRAKELLRRGDLGLKQIAAAIGFPSIQHFCNVFKRETGLPPGKFARLQGGPG